MTDIAQRPSRRLEVEAVELIGGGRRVYFGPGLNLISGDITTGKTTFVRLLRGLLGTFPSNMAPETNRIEALAGTLLLGSRQWQIYRPRSAASSTPVQLTETTLHQDGQPLSLRLPAAGRQDSYSTLLLDQLSIPVVSVPQARSKPTEGLTPVTMTDWLGYCIITGDEIDTQVFGHHHPFRDIKRRWVFELAYGLYNAEIAQMAAKLHAIDLQIANADLDAAAQEKFLAQTRFASTEALHAEIDRCAEELHHVQALRKRMGAESQERVPGTSQTRARLLAARAERTELADEHTRLQGQLKDLRDLRTQLKSQIGRLTRAIVAEEWLVDFDFVVCPRCGTDVNPDRVSGRHCYLCLQEPTPPTATRDNLLGEQDRVKSQIVETEEVIENRSVALTALTSRLQRLDADIVELQRELDERTETFVSDHAERIEQAASQQAGLAAKLTYLHEYLELIERHRDQAQSRDELMQARDELAEAIAAKELDDSSAEANIQALEQRLLEHLRELHIPQFSDDLSVHINRKTFLPEIAGRTFDELSSQGLKTLVNIAHALAHHTVAIDRSLPLPGLLVLDGLSANSGFEGFDQERVFDVYRLLMRVSADYENELQVIAIDNQVAYPLLEELIAFNPNVTRLTLRQSDRLIRVQDETPTNS
jgi:hypothetical protein